MWVVECAAPDVVCLHEMSRYTNTLEAESIYNSHGRKELLYLFDPARAWIHLELCLLRASNVPDVSVRRAQASVCSLFVETGGVWRKRRGTMKCVVTGHAICPPTFSQ